MSHAVCHIQASFNNTIVTFTDPQGNAISWASAGGLRISEDLKNQLHLLHRLLLKKLLKKQLSMVYLQLTLKLKVQVLDVKMQLGHYYLVGLKITSVADKSPMPHNGCRAPKRRRV
jgi:small subunit ribosomal protein S11